MSTMFPKFSKRVEGNTVVMEQRLLKKTSQLILDASKCVGCGICVEVCPRDAVKIGMVGAANRGATTEAAVFVDPAVCSYCGVCTIMCPFNSLELRIDGEKSLPIREQEGFPEYDYTTEIDESKCDRCTICSEACPHDAIVRDVPKYEGTVEGGVDRHVALADAKVEFVNDKEKCTLCGICSSLCPALHEEKNPLDAKNTKVTGELVWDESKCDACNVCVDACPNKALKVTRKLPENLKLAGNISIDHDDCITCTWCKTVCPNEAVKVTKFFEGEVTFNADKCPGGCSTCLDVCPCHAIYLPTPLPATMLKRDSIEDKIAVNHDLCILCGACVNACPSEDVITIRRTKVHFKGEVTDLAKKIETELCIPRTSKVVEKLFGQVETKPVE
ncbi:MAG TPA: 4Fe-4S binding protein [Methanocorpusculum sp.]|nr:4Fe-4S binding protein [Methanocorpusculum sp.]